MQSGARTPFRTGRISQRSLSCHINPIDREQRLCSEAARLDCASSRARSSTLKEQWRTRCLREVAQ